MHADRGVVLHRRRRRRHPRRAADRRGRHHRLSRPDQRRARHPVASTPLSLGARDRLLSFSDGWPHRPRAASPAQGSMRSPSSPRQKNADSSAVFEVLGSESLGGLDDGALVVLVPAAAVVALRDARRVVQARAVTLLRSLHDTVATCWRWWALRRVDGQTEQGHGQAQAEDTPQALSVRPDGRERGSPVSQGRLSASPRGAVGCRTSREPGTPGALARAHRG